jgi:hypothetical protein
MNKAAGFDGRLRLADYLLHHPWVGFFPSVRRQAALLDVA